jgi:hypothetical protein
MLRLVTQPVRPVRVRTRRPIVPRAAIDLQEGVALTGKFVGLFVLFTSSMNWWAYRRIRKDREDKK